MSSTIARVSQSFGAALFTPVRLVQPHPKGYLAQLAADGRTLVLQTRSGQRIPTQVRPHSTTSAELVAVATQAQTSEGLDVAEVAIVDAPQYAALPTWAAVKDAETEDGAPLLTVRAFGGAVYEARLVLAKNRVRTGGVRYSQTFDAELVRVSGPGPEHAGWIKGHVDSFFGLPMAEWSMRWATSDVDRGKPIGEFFFHDMKLEAPEGVVQFARSRGLWMQNIDDGFLVATDVDPHTQRQARNKVLRFGWVAAAQAPLLPAYLGAPGFAAAHGSAHGIASYHGGNPETPVQLDGGIVPTSLPDDLVQRMIADADQFLAEREDGAQHAGSVIGQVGWIHPSGVPYGGITGGVLHDGPVQTLASFGVPQAHAYAWERAESWLDRTSGFITIHGQPHDPLVLDPSQMMHPERRFTWNVSPAPPGEQNVAMIPRRSEDPYGLLDAPTNGPEGTGGLDEEQRERFGSPDAQHALYALSDLQVLAEWHADPLAMDLCGELAVSYANDLAYPQGALIAPGRGTEMNRAEGWALRACAVAAAYLPGTEAARIATEWGEMALTTVRTGRMPNGGLLAWQVPTKKEVKQAWEEAGKRVAIAQAYQGAIWLDGLRHAREPFGVSANEIRSLTWHLCVVPRRPGDRAPRYRYGVYDLDPMPVPVIDDDGEPTGEFTETPVAFDFEGTAAIYASTDESEHHHTYVLATAIAYELPPFSVEVTGYLTDYAQGLTHNELLQELTSSIAKFGNAEELVARLAMRGDTVPE